MRRPRPLVSSGPGSCTSGGWARSWSTTLTVTVGPSTVTVSSNGVAAWRTALVTTSLTSRRTVSASPAVVRLLQHLGHEVAGGPDARRARFEVLTAVDAGNATAAGPRG